jgi:hypothetical protein
MRTREKARIWRRFMAGESVFELQHDWGKYAFKEASTIEAIIREGAAGKFDPLPIKLARAYGQADGVKFGRQVGV